MIEKLREADERFREIDAFLADPDAVRDREKYREMMKEQKKLSPIIEKYREYLDCEKLIAETGELLAEKNDPEFRRLLENELFRNRNKLAALEEEIRILLLPRDEDDEKNVIIEIRAGAGGDEAALFAARLFRMYSMYAEKNGWKTELTSCSETGLGGMKEVSFLVIGEGAYSRLKFESGVHRVQRVPETEASGRIHTSTVTVAVLPEAEEVTVEINPADITVESIKATGAGGQHVNKTESAVRLTHKPSGIVIECREERSQFQNRDRAMQLLRSKLYHQRQTEQREKIAAERKTQVGTGERCERIRTYNFPQGRVTDHRIGLTLYAIDNFLDGDMQELIDSLIAFDTAEKLKKGLV